MTAATNPESLQQYKVKFSLIVEQILILLQALTLLEQ